MGDTIQVERSKVSPEVSNRWAPWEMDEKIRLNSNMYGERWRIPWKKEWVYSKVIMIHHILISKLLFDDI